MNVNGWLQYPAALSLGKESPVLIDCKSEWIPEPV